MKPKNEHEAIEQLNDLIDFVAGSEMPGWCKDDKKSCGQKLNVTWGRPLTNKEYDGLCPACRAYWHLSAARNDIIEHLRRK